MSALQNILFGSWTPPAVAATHSYRVMSVTPVESERKKSKPVHARTKIMSVLDSVNWMSNEDIAIETEMLLTTVQTTTSKMCDEGRIERQRLKTQKTKPICFYRKK